MRALRLLAGPAARRHLREHGLRPQHVGAVPGAAGGPKGLVLNALDRFVFGRWLAGGTQVVHLAGASIGAWRLACACLPDADAALATLAHDYVHEDYGDPGATRRPSAAHVTATFRAQLARQFGGLEAAALAHPRFRLHVFASRGSHALLAGRGTLRTAAGCLGAFGANLVARRAMGGWLERVVFSDPRDPLPWSLDDYPTRRVRLASDNLAESILASCSIPFWLEPVLDIRGAPPGAYWDGGLTDYHLHLDYASMPGDSAAPLVLYPHFQPEVVPGWLDKGLRRRHRATPALDNVVLLVPDPDWVRTLPGGKLPDRGDFSTWKGDAAGRMAAWRRAVAEGERLAAEFDAIASRPGGVEAEPLA